MNVLKFVFLLREFVAKRVKVVAGYMYIIMKADLFESEGSGHTCGGCTGKIAIYSTKNTVEINDECRLKNQQTNKEGYQDLYYSRRAQILAKNVGNKRNLAIARSALQRYF